METLMITPERFQQALAWMNGQASTLGEQEVLQMLRSMTGRFQENCRALRPGPVARFRNLRITPHPLSMSAIMREAETEQSNEETPRKIDTISDSSAEKEPTQPLTPEQEVVRTVEQEIRLDSALLLNAISYVATLAGCPLTQSKAQLILYCLYGAQLGAGKERLPIEHPQVWKYGPVFPRAYKRSTLEDRNACEAAYQELLEKEPDLLAALISKTEAMMGTSMSDLCAVHKSSKSPYGCTKALFPEKWGVPIADKEIKEFFAQSNDA